MDIMVHFPDDVGKAVSQQPNVNEFLVNAAKNALRDRFLDEHTEIALQEAERGEYATEEVSAFFAQWSNHKT